MSNVSNNKSDFERIIDRSYDLAVSHRHEYVIVEHVLAALLEFDDIKKLLENLNCDSQSLSNDVREFLADPSYHSIRNEVAFQPKYTPTLMTIIKQAKVQSMFMGKTQMNAVDLFLTLFYVEHSHASYFLAKHGVTKDRVTSVLSATASVGNSPMVNEEEAIAILSQYAVNLNSQAQQKRINPLIGREDDVELLVETLARKLKNNVLLVGHPGVGKTQLVEGLAQRIVNKSVPPSLQDQEIWSLDINSVVAGTKYRGDFEERMKSLLIALKSLPNVILFIDEIHMIMGAGGGSQGAMDAANIFKPALGRGEIRTIGSTTFEEYRKHFEKDRALLRRFQKQDVNEPSSEDSKRILKGLIEGFEKFHKVKYDADCVDAAVDLSVKYLSNKYLPDKAIDLIDASGASVKVDISRDKKKVTVADVEEQISRLAKISLEKIEQSQSDKLANLDKNIRAQLFGQESAVIKLCDAVWLAYSGLRESNKTMGAFLLTGPSGVGKTAIAQLLAQELGYVFHRFDMSEFQEKHSVARFIGSPPGYVGYSDGSAGSGALINALETSPSCVLLIDEVEKAHPDVLNIFLQAMDRGEVTSQTQKTVSMRNVILIFTSNLGAAASEKDSIGFGRGKVEGADVAAVKQFFAPEFRNRLDAVIPFSPLSKDVMKSIVGKFLQQLNQQARDKNVRVTVDPQAHDWLAENGYDPLMGARPLSRVIDDHIKKPMSKEILFGKLVNGGSVLVTVVDNKLKLEFLCNAKLALAGPVSSMEVQEESLS